MLWLHPDDAPSCPQDVDRFTTAEIPSKKDDPMLHDLVTKWHIHGPCKGTVADGPPCLDKYGNCQHDFPKPFRLHTTFDDKSMPSYMRRSPEQGGHTTLVYCRYLKREVTVDNRYVVPYNKFLLAKYKAHCNIELIGSVGMYWFIVCIDYFLI